MQVELLREPGGVVLSERIRELVKDPALEIGARAEALLYAAARAELVDERVRPLLQQGVTVLLDRFVDSSLAYQGAGRGLGIEQVRAINLLATGGLAPDRTLLLQISPATGPRPATDARHRARPAGARGRILLSERSPPPMSSSRATSHSASARSTASKPRRVCSSRRSLR